MATGLLEVHGTIDLTQFWPTGESDADTTKVLLSVGPDAFQFRAKPKEAFKVTHAFEGATAKGRGSKEVIDKKGRVTIRLQGIDAPELHYRPQFPTKLDSAQQAAFSAVNADFRQFYGETSTTALAAHLRKIGKSPLPCVVRTEVDSPDDVFDTYGRLIGDIWVTDGGKDADVNHWLVENGWAFQTYYVSMSPGEIHGVEILAAAAEQKKLGIWKHLSLDAKEFDWKLVCRLHGVPAPVSDVGPVLMPKVFRRFSTYSVAHKAGIPVGTFDAYLKAHQDACVKATDFFSQGGAAPKHHLDEFVDGKGHLSFKPGDLVFDEAPSHLVGPTGQPVHW